MKCAERVSVGRYIMRILFQGDSITDAGRDRSEPHNLSGYTRFVAQTLGNEHEYINLGISGNRSIDLLDRYEHDFQAINADIVVLLIGINDVWRGFDSNLYTSPAEFRKNLTELLMRLKRDNPKAKLILLEPYLLPAPDKCHWRRNLAEIIQEVRSAAVTYADALIPLDGLFAEACMHTAWENLSSDGVHPDIKGQQLIAKHVAQAIRACCK